MSKKKDANTLLEITAALSIWRDAGSEGPKQSEDVRKAAAKAMKLLRDNADLLHRCENAYKINNRKAKMSLDKLNWMLDSTDNQDPEFITKRIGYYDYQDFAQDHLINELNRWANELEAETEQENKDAKREREGMIQPKPPEIFQKILWIKKYGRKHWKLVSLAILIVLCIWILSKINLFR